MKEKLNHHFSHFWWSIKNWVLKSNNIIILLLFLTFLPLVILGIFTFIHVYQNDTKAVLVRRESLGRSVAQLAEMHLDHLVDHGIHYSSHPKFQQLVSEKKWEDALSSLVEEQKPLDSSIESIVLFDTDSTAKVDFPHLPDFDNNIKGRQFADRDWYKGVSRNWQPYVTKVFKRFTEPRINIVSVVIPIKSIFPDDNGRILGILNLSISLDNFYEWSKSLNSDPQSILYFVDQKGQIAGHPDYSQDGEIIDYSNVPAVQRLLKGKEGVDVLYNPLEKKERVSTYFKVGKYNWGLVIAQEISEAFRERGNELRYITIFIIIIILISSFILFILYRLFFLVNKYRYKEYVILESIGDGVFVVDKKFNIILWNKAASLITGLSPEDVIGKNCCDIFRFIDAKTHRNKNHTIQEAIRRGEIKHLDNNTLMVLNNGRKIPIGDSAAPIFSGKGRVDGAIVIFHDLTGEHNLNQDKDEFLSIAAHQLHTPLGVMRWNMELILKEKFGEITKETKEALGDMFHNNLNLINLVNDLLDVSRINQGKVINKPQDMEIFSVVKKILNERESEIKKRNIFTKIVIPKEKMPKIHVDRNLFEQVVRNLVSNAIKYNRRQGSIEIKAEKLEKVIRLIIINTGIGIPKTDVERVFEKFHRADNAVSRGIAGTGLGLFVVKSYVEMMKGKVWLESEVGKETKAVIEIPYI